jgi:hypothetical protein
VPLKVLGYSFSGGLGDPHGLALAGFCVCCAIVGLGLRCLWIFVMNWTLPCCAPCASSAPTGPA